MPYRGQCGQPERRSQGCESGFVRANRGPADSFLKQHGRRILDRRFGQLRRICIGLGCSAHLHISLAKEMRQVRKKIQEDSQRSGPTTRSPKGTAHLGALLDVNIPAELSLHDEFDRTVRNFGMKLHLRQLDEWMNKHGFDT